MVTTLFNFFVAVGSEWVLWILIALSIASLTVIFERWRHLRNQERVGALLWKERLEDCFSGQAPLPNAEEAERLRESHPCLESELLAIVHRKDNPRDPSKVLHAFLQSRRLKLERNLPFLGTLGNNAPFIGLAGTVLGIIRAFHDLGQGSANIQGLSGGLAEALVATAVGLFVALPAVAFYNFYSRKIKAIMSRAESLADFTVGSLYGR